MRRVKRALGEIPYEYQNGMLMAVEPKLVYTIDGFTCLETFVKIFTYPIMNVSAGNNYIIPKINALKERKYKHFYVAQYRRKKLNFEEALDYLEEKGLTWKVKKLKNVYYDDCKTKTSNFYKIILPKHVMDYSVKEIKLFRNALIILRGSIARNIDKDLDTIKEDYLI